MKNDNISHWMTSQKPRSGIVLRNSSDKLSLFSPSAVLFDVDNDSESEGVTPVEQLELLAIFTGYLSHSAL
ncbi:hypothetical protein J6590_097931 [Homalodisca vitripennis]|nr:hypothetical protein J6590_097931 [Homalodisca vitripennis]